MTYTITLPRAVIEQAIESMQGYARETGDTQPCDAEKALSAALAQQAEQVPDAYQFRMRADWVTNWGEWGACNKERHDMYLRFPKMHSWNYETRELYAAHKVAQQASCEWKKDPDNEMGDTYHSNCGESWSFVDGGPKENRVSYCHHCGKPVNLAAPKGGV